MSIMGRYNTKDPTLVTEYDKTRPGRPKLPPKEDAVPEPNTLPSQTDILQQIAQTLAQVQAQVAQGQTSGNAAALDKMTQTLAELATRTRPENPEHPDISAYSNPTGEKSDPKPAFKCDMYWVGYPLVRETQTPAEIEALNLLEPGSYRVTKANGVTIPFTVEGKRRQNGTLDSLWVTFPCKGDQSTDHRSQIAYCREAMGQKVASVDDLMAEIQTLRAELQVAQSVIEAA